MPPFNPNSLADIRTFWLAAGRHPARRLGQNFLADANIVHIIIKAAEPQKCDTVLEIGPGLGALTLPLAERAGRLIAIEKDHRLFEHLQRELAALPNVQLIHADALDCDYTTLLPDNNFKLVANLPYSSGTAMLVNFLQSNRLPAAIIVTMQKEVALRITAQPGSRHYGLLSLWSSLHYTAEIAKIIKPTCFWPPPLVDSAIVVMRRLAAPAIVLNQPARFFELTKHIFGQRRKQLAAALRAAPDLRRIPPAEMTQLLATAGLTPRQRPETMSIHDWGRLVNLLKQFHIDA